MYRWLSVKLLMPAHVQISLFRRMPLLPGGAVMTQFAILLTTSELTSPVISYNGKSSIDRFRIYLS